MKRLSAAVFALLSCLALAGCGEKTVTFTATQGTLVYSVVATASQDGIDSVKKKVAAQSSGADVKLSDGDQHQGNKICEADVTDSGFKYHIVVYSSIPLPATSCDSFNSGSSSSSNGGGGGGGSSSSSSSSAPASAPASSSDSSSSGAPAPSPT